MAARRRLGIGVVGFGWMGQAHSRSAARIASLFPERQFDTDLIVCGDNVPGRGELAIDGFGFREAVSDWRAVVDHPDVDVVYVTAPNMMHEPVAVAAAEAGKAVFCEKPVGGKPDQTVRIAAAAERAGVITGVGYNYRWAPLVQHAKHLIDSGQLGEITNYRGRFFSMYGADPMGLLSWRFLVDEAGHGVSSDILSHSVDLATMLIGPIDRVSGTMETFIKERPLAKPGGSHYDVGQPGDPTGQVTNEDYAAAMVVFANGARGTFETSRAIIGPESQMAFDVYGTKGALRWNLETMNELEVFLVDDAGSRAARLHHGVRRRPLPVSWALRSGRCQLDRIRGPQGDRELRVPVGGRPRRAARARVRPGGRVRQLPDRVAALLRVGHVGGRRPDREVMTTVDYSLTGPSAQRGRRSRSRQRRMVPTDDRSGDAARPADAHQPPGGGRGRAVGGAARRLRRVGMDDRVVVVVDPGLRRSTARCTAAPPIRGGTSAGTARRSAPGWVNDLIYPIASFMQFRGPTVWRWSHYRHHTDTIIVGRDAEIVFQRPPSVARAIWMFSHIEGGLEDVLAARQARLRPDRRRRRRVRARRTSTARSCGSRG